MPSYSHHSIRWAVGYTLITLMVINVWSGDMHVSLVWDALHKPEVVGYNMYYGEQSNLYTNKINVGNTVDCVVSNLVAGITYHFAVTAELQDGSETPFSGELTYTIPIIPPSTPTSPSGLSLEK